MENGLKINLNNQEKELLLQDLCARLPYKVKIQCINSDNETVIEELFTIGIEEDSFDCNLIEYVSVKPYLFPLSSMTDGQKTEWNYIDYYADHHEAVDWLNKNHFDFRNLIGRGLAIDCTNLNIY